MEEKGTHCISTIAFPGSLKPTSSTNYNGKQPPIQRAHGHYIHACARQALIGNRQAAMLDRRMRS